MFSWTIYLNSLYGKVALVAFSVLAALSFEQMLGVVRTVGPALEFPVVHDRRDRRHRGVPGGQGSVGPLWSQRFGWQQRVCRGTACPTSWQLRLAGCGRRRRRCCGCCTQRGQQTLTERRNRR